MSLMRLHSSVHEIDAQACVVDPTTICGHCAGIAQHLPPTSLAPHKALFDRW